MKKTILKAISEPINQPVTNRRDVDMIKVDDRTEAQKVTHRWGIVAKDKFMSGWGQADNGVSRCAWACGEGVNIDRVENWVRNRKEMRHVNVVDLNSYRAPRGTVHFHIYVCNADHIANQ